MGTSTRRTPGTSTWQPYCSPLLTNQDANYNLRRTLLTLLRQYRYLTTTNLCLLMWNHCSLVFHFNWHYSVPRPLYNNLLLNYRYRQKTSWTYWTEFYRVWKTCSPNFQYFVLVELNQRTHRVHQDTLDYWLYWSFGNRFLRLLLCLQFLLSFLEETTLILT